MVAVESTIINVVFAIIIIIIIIYCIYIAQIPYIIYYSKEVKGQRKCFDNFCMSSLV